MVFFGLHISAGSLIEANTSDETATVGHPIGLLIGSKRYTRSPHSKNSVYDQLEDALIEAGLDPRFPDGVNTNQYRYVGTKEIKMPDGTIKTKQIRERIGEYKPKLKDGWTFKHLRNIGGKKRHGITGDERDHFLGHIDPGQSRWYAGDADETYLLPLVSLIGQEYFDGETVATNI